MGRVRSRVEIRVEEAGAEKRRRGKNDGDIHDSKREQNSRMQGEYCVQVAIELLYIYQRYPSWTPCVLIFLAVPFYGKCEDK